MRNEKEMNFVLRLVSLTFLEQDVPWWQDRANLSQLFQVIQESPFAEKLTYFGKEGKKQRQHVAAYDEIIEDAKLWQEGIYTLQSGKKTADTLLELTIRKKSLNLTLLTSAEAVGANVSTLMKYLIEFAVQLHESFQGTAVCGPEFHIIPSGVSYPRPKPPRKHPRWPIGSVVDFVSKPFLVHEGDGGKESWQKLSSAPLPKGVSRQQKEDLLIFQWVQDFEDVQAVAAGRTLQERWLGQLLEWPVAAGFNALGDKQETLWGQQAHPPLTFYVDMAKHGYKAVVQNPDGTVDEELFSEMASWIKAGKLPDGTSLEQLQLIVPNRDTAVALRSRADEIGVTKVFYTGENGTLWNPWPPGEWSG